MSAGTPEDGAGDVPEDVEDLPPQTIEGRVSELEDVVEDLGAALVDLARRRPAGTGAGQAEDEGKPNAEDAAPARSWVARASTEDWRELAAWVDWLNATYDLRPSKSVFPCWPAHSGVVLELAALRAAWVSAATVEASDEPGDAMTSWHGDLLRPCLARLHEDYQLGACEDRHKPPRAPRPTDADLLSAALERVSSTSDDDLNEGDVNRSTGELR
ncbi:hypothetical protein [Pseudokineococcus marinus]|uniref:DUF4913 domain-containing protein n=1 Tax=Pseudokineococcus marinus TaxID=351215 RepID=A0A849BKX1_9ACTN|nr:hypothetical protein [Pseudokineococcus marinus]NNH21737.1 hypothetical protein [Pseudokineococcus marinus]